MNRHTRRTVQGAFTLVEVLVAIIIFGIVAIGGMSFFMYGRTHINSATNTRQALEIARQKMEIIKAASYSDIASATEGGLALGDLTAQRITTVSSISDGNGVRKQISVQVNWPENHPTGSVTLYTIIAQP